MKYFKLQKAFKLYVYYIVLWMYNSPDKKEGTTKEEVGSEPLALVSCSAFVGIVDKIRTT